MHTNVLTALLGVSLGIVCGEISMYGSEVAVALLLLGTAQLLLFFFAKVTAQKNVLLKNTQHFSIPLLSGIFFIALVVGITRVQFSDSKHSFVCHEACAFSATVVTSPESKGAYQVFVVRPDGEDTSYDVQVRAPLYPQVSVGDSLTLFGKVTLPRARMEHTGIRTFDYMTYLQIHNIGSEMFYPKMEILTKEGKQVSATVRTLKHLQEVFLGYIFLYVSEPSASLASGMLFGNTSMSPSLVETFRVAGLSHIVVLSGFNIAILIGFILLALSFVPLIIRVVVAGTVVILFVVMVGAEVSIIRATLMSFIALTALLVGKGYTARQALLLSLLCIILYEPRHLLHDVSLHLSFLATAGIVYMGDGIKMFLAKIQSNVYKEIMTTTLAAYLATLPYTLYTFGTISLYALFANVIVLPLVPLMMLVTFLTVVTAPLIEIVGMFFGYVTTLLGSFIIFIARLLEGLPFSSIRFEISLAGMVLVYSSLIVSCIFFVVRQKNKRDETDATGKNEILAGIFSY